MRGPRGGAPSRALVLGLRSEGSSGWPHAGESASWSPEASPGCACPSSPAPRDTTLSVAPAVPPAPPADVALHLSVKNRNVRDAVRPGASWLLPLSNQLLWVLLGDCHCSCCGGTGSVEASGRKPTHPLLSEA